MTATSGLFGRPRRWESLASVTLPLRESLNCDSHSQSDCESELWKHSASLRNLRLLSPVLDPDSDSTTPCPERGENPPAMTTSQKKNQEDDEKLEHQTWISGGKNISPRLFVTVAQRSTTWTVLFALFDGDNRCDPCILGIPSISHWVVNEKHPPHQVNIPTESGLNRLQVKNQL